MPNRGSWSESNNKDYKALYNYLVENKIFDDIEEHQYDYPQQYGKQLLKNIMDNDKLGKGAKKNKLYMLANWYLKHDPKNSYI